MENVRKSLTLFVQRAVLPVFRFFPALVFAALTVIYKNKSAVVKHAREVKK